MTGDDEEFARFVAARWPALEGVALAGTLDGDASRTVTTSALAAVRARWAEALEDGAPTAAAQSALLERLARWTPTAAPAALPTPVDADDPVPPALLAALAHEEPLVRAALAAGPLWERGPAQVAALLGRAGRDLPSRVDAARGRLLRAHRTALTTEGLAPADHRLDADLESLLRGLAAARPEPPDPAALVAHRTGRARRRALLLGGAGVAALGVVGWGAVHGPRGSTAAPAPSAATTPEPARWATTRTWPARGALVDDPEVRAAVSQADGGRLLWADEVQGVRAVVVAVPDPQQTGTAFRVWAGPLPAVGPLTEVQYPFNQLFDVPDLVALGLPRGSGAVVLVLAEPTVRTAEFSPVVRIPASGEVERDWAQFPLDEGVGVLTSDSHLGMAARIRCARYDGPLPRPREWGEESYSVPTDHADQAADAVAEATGLASQLFEVEVREYRLPSGSAGVGLLQMRSGTLTRIDVRTPTGGVVRSQVLAVEGAGGDSATYGDGSVALPADLAGAPWLFQVDDGDGAAYLVSVSEAAATVRLSGTDDAGEPVTARGRVRDGLAVVAFPGGGYTLVDRIVVEDPGGRTVFDDPPVSGRDPYDLYDLYGV